MKGGDILFEKCLELYAFKLYVKYPNYVFMSVRYVYNDSQFDS